MNCKDWEERLALFAGRDLTPEQGAELERHLAECPGCQMFVSGLRESLELLQGAHGDELSPAHFTAVRSRVLAEIEREHRPFWRRAWGYGLAAAAAALLAAVSVWPGKPPAAPVVTLSRPPVPVVVARATVPAPPKKSLAAHHRRTEPGEPVMVKLVTSNPDVVIYWIADRRGDY